MSMRNHAIFWNYLMMILGSLAGLLFVLVGIVDMAQADAVASKISGATAKDVVLACTVFICCGSLAVIINLTVAFLSAYYIKTAKVRKPLIIMGILSLIFNMIVPGILMLCIKQQELDEPYTPYVPKKK